MMLDRRRFTAGLAASLVATPAWAAGNDALLGRAKAALDRHGDRIRLRDRVALADFSRHSSFARFHLVDLVAGSTRSYLVAHGKGSDPDHSGWLRRFSNDHGSLATSSGAYITGNLYSGKYGRSIRLQGLDPTNSNAEDRAIVMHTAGYVSRAHIGRWSKLGRSDGCFVLENDTLSAVLGLLGPWRLLYADGVGSGGGT